VKVERQCWGGAPDADVLAAAIEILQKRIAAGTALGQSESALRRTSE